MVDFTFTTSAGHDGMTIEVTRRTDEIEFITKNRAGQTVSTVRLDLRRAEYHLRGLSVLLSV